MQLNRSITALITYSRSEKGIRMLGHCLWLLLGAVVAKGGGLVSSIIVAHILGRSGLGYYGMILGTVVMFQTFADMGLGVTVTKHVSEYRVTNPRRAAALVRFSCCVGIGFSIVVCLGLLVSSSWLASKVLGDTGLVPYLRLAAVAIVFGSMDSLLSGVLRGLESFRSLSCISMLHSVANVALQVAGVFWFGLTGVTLALVVGVCWKMLLAGLFLRREIGTRGWSFSDAGRFDFWPVLWKFSLPALLMGLMVDPVGWLSSAILVRQPDGFVENGYFGATAGWCALVSFVPVSISAVALPVMSSFFGKGDGRGFWRYLVWKCVLLGLLGAVVGIPVIVFAEPIMRLYGEAFASGATVLRLGVLAAMLIAVQNPLYAALSGAGRMWRNLGVAGAWAVTLLLASWWLIPRYGAVGRAAALLLAYTVNTAVFILFVGLGARTWFRGSLQEMGEPCEDKPGQW